MHFRAAYIKAKVGVLVPSQIRALRYKSDMPKQSNLAKAAGMWQSQISTAETPGSANMTLAMLARLAAVFRVGLIVKFVPFSEMLHWENTFSQDEFNVVRIEHDRTFLTSPQQRQDFESRTYSYFPPAQPTMRSLSSQEIPLPGILAATAPTPQAEARRLSLCPF